MLTRLLELQQKINATQSEWTAYLEQIHASSQEHRIDNAASSSSHSVLETVNSLEARNAKAKQRFRVIQERSRLDEPRGFPPIAEVVAQEMREPSRSTETLATQLLRATMSAKAYVDILEDLVEIGERKTSERLCAAQLLNHRLMTRLSGKGVKRTMDCATKAKVMVEKAERILAFTEDANEASETSELIEGVRDLMKEPWELLGYFELGTLRLLVLLASSGVRVARQSMIEEFFTKVGEH